MTDSQLLKYQSLLFEGPIIKLKVVETNPATFLSEKEDETHSHDCPQYLTLNYAAQGDLMDTPLDNSDMNVFIDGRVFFGSGWKMESSYFVVTSKQVLETKYLLPSTSAQLAEFVSLT